MMLSMVAQALDELGSSGAPVRGVDRLTGNIVPGGAADYGRLMTWSADLIDQLDFYWTVHFRPRLEGLTDAEYRWEPVPGMWSVRPDAAGRLVADFLVPEPPIPPVTTIA